MKATLLRAAPFFGAGTLFLLLTLPNTGLTDVAAPEGQLEKTADETCPAATDVAGEDLELFYTGSDCSLVSVDNLYAEEDTRCFYAVTMDCPTTGCGG